MINLGTNFALDNQVRTEPKVAQRQSMFLEEKGSQNKATSDTAAELKVESEPESIVKDIEKVNKILLVKSTNLVFEFDEKTEPPVVKVVDKHNGEIIREIPSKELREIAKALNNIADTINSNSGVLLNERL